MLTNYDFWASVVMLSWGSFAMNAEVNFRGSNMIAKLVIFYAGCAGYVLGLISTITMCIQYDWWLFIPVILVQFIVSFMMSIAIRGLATPLFAEAGIVGIPILYALTFVF